MSEKTHKTYVPTFNQREQAKKVIEACYNNLRYNEDNDTIRYTRNGKRIIVNFYEFYTDITSYGIGVKTRELKVLLDQKSA